MLKELSDRLSKIVEQKRLKEKLDRDFRAVEMELLDKSTRLSPLRIQLDREKIDVEKLERTSLTSLFYSVLGSREQQLEKERQELLSAQLLYQHHKEHVEYLEQEKDRLSHQLEKLMDIDAKYEIILSEKESVIQQSNQITSKELFKISEELANLGSELREITEALTAGNNVLTDLNQAIKSLESAENWGVWDMLGGGFISDMVKHSHIDDARNNVNRAQKNISQFKRELSDVQKDADVQINIGDLTSFADFFLDGLIFDWIVQSKIEDSLSQSKSAKNIIAKTVGKLEILRESTQNRFDDMKEKRAFLIEDT
jgi:DNA repair exonuclease SbcCD ATPase subunit